jgi:hypothetical protein
MFEDLEALVREFDVQTLTRPASPEQFMFSLVVVAILFACGWVALKLLGRLFG